MRSVLTNGFRLGLVALAMAALFLPDATSQTADGRVLLVVKLPPDATLTIDKTTTKSTGAVRSFISPPLVPGKQYFYTLNATWKENGQEKSATKDILVKAGEKVEVALGGGEAVAKAEPKVPAKIDEPKKVDEPKVVAKGEPKVRNFLFTYQAVVTDLKPGQTAKVWLPAPQTTEHQEVSVEDTKGLPQGHQVGREKQYGNQMVFVEAKAGDDGTIPLAVTYKVSRKEVRGGAKQDTDTAEQLARFLQPDALVPIEGKPIELIKGKTIPADQTKAGKVVYDVVNTHMKYSKEGKGWGRGDAVWACDSKFGNCTDFHSLFISIARNQKIPAKFEMGFSVPEKRGEGDIGGYHCWAFFKPLGEGWTPVDISEANRHPSMKDYYFGNLTEDRVQFTTGRDITLEPKQDGEPLNFFIYPYVEVDGKPYDAAKVKRKFSFKDL